MCHDKDFLRIPKLFGSWYWAVNVLGGKCFFALRKFLSAVFKVNIIYIRYSSKWLVRMFECLLWLWVALRWFLDYNKKVPDIFSRTTLKLNEMNASWDRNCYKSNNLKIAALTPKPFFDLLLLQNSFLSYRVSSPPISI